MQMQEIASWQINSIEKDKICLDANDFLFKETLLEVNKHSLKQLILAFLREAIFPYRYEDNTLIFEFSRSNYLLYVNHVKLFSLLRFTQFSTIVLLDKKTNSEQLITTPLGLLDVVKVELDITLNHEQWNKVYKEIDNHLQNAILSNQEKSKLKKKFSLEKNKRKHFNFFLFFYDYYKVLSNFSLKFEQLVFNGHPYHPCSKTKLGFSIEDVLQYSPEFCPTVSIFFAAVNKDYLHVEKSTGKPDFSEWFANYYPDFWEKWLVALQNLGLNCKDYLPFPIHPWQAAHIIPDLFVDLFKEKKIILVNNLTIKMSPTLSFRTLAPLEYSQAPYIKLSIAIQATSVIRTISNASTENTPKITSILEKILLKENHFSGRLFILPEYYGLHLKGVDEEKSKNFTAIFRENLNNYLKKDEVCIVIASLFEKISPYNRSFFIDLLELAGCLSYEKALDYFCNYTDIVLGSYLDLYLIYGIALEGHQQNTLAVFQNGKIKHFIARDFHGIEIYADCFNTHEFSSDNALALSFPFITHNRQSVRNQLLHTVYQLHLGELVLLLATYFNCEEKFFWNIIKYKTEERFMVLKSRCDLMRWEEEYHAILKESWTVKALFRMRLEKQHICKGIFTTISNPLAG